MVVAFRSTVVAAEARLGEVTLKLPPPSGFCELSESNASDKRMLTIIRDLLTKSGNKLLGYSADCQQLRDWRANKRQLLDDYAQYQASLTSLDKPPTETVQQTCATLRAEGDKIHAEQKPDAKSRVEAALKKVKVNESTFIGVVAEEPNACFAGVIQQLHTEAGTDKTQLTVFAVTTVKNRTVFAYRFAVYGPTSVDGLTAKLKNDVAALHAANR
jgi:hypothetical protein